MDPANERLPLPIASDPALPIPGGQVVNVSYPPVAIYLVPKKQFYKVSSAAEFEQLVPDRS
jgi:hypothetical protein